MEERKDKKERGKEKRKKYVYNVSLQARISMLKFPEKPPTLRFGFLTLIIRTVLFFLVYSLFSASRRKPVNNKRTEPLQYR